MKTAQLTPWRNSGSVCSNRRYFGEHQLAPLRCSARELRFRDSPDLAKVMQLSKMRTGLETKLPNSRPLSITRHYLPTEPTQTITPAPQKTKTFLLTWTWIELVAWGNEKAFWPRTKLDSVSLFTQGVNISLALILDSDDKAVILFKVTRTVCDYLKACDERDIPVRHS